MNNIEETDNLIKKSFQDNPSYSFSNWEIMYNHSRTVRDFALKISKNFSNADKEVVTIGALLHDIGKATKTDEETLRRDHGKLAYEFSKDFLKTLDLTSAQQELLKEILEENSDSMEAKIIKDADTIAFFSDKNLQTTLKNWADKKGINNELQRKSNKFEKLHFEESKKIAKPFAEEMKSYWGL